MQNLPNIEKSAFRRSQSNRPEYVGYQDGAWRISGHQGHWRASHQTDRRYAPITARTLSELSALLAAAVPQ